MTEAIQRFRETGDYQDCLEVLDVEPERALPALQSALKHAGSQDERNALEDIAFALTREASRSAPELRIEAAEAARRQFGDKVADFVDITKFVDGFVSASGEAPSLNSIVAAIGLEADRRVANRVQATPRDAGKTFSVWLASCQVCSHQLGAGGHILCKRCFERALADVRRGQYSARDLSGEQLAAGVLVQFSSRYGCRECGHQPARVCDCSRSVTIPSGPRDGQLLKGKYTRSGKECWFTLELRGAS